MKKLCTLTLSLGLLTVLFSSPALAGKKEDKAEKKETNKALRGFDKNANGEIDGEEKVAIQTAFATEPLLKQFDLNGDGKLEESEVSAIKIKAKKQK